SLERRRAGGGGQHRGHDGDSAPLRAAAVRCGSRAALPHAHRHGLEPERRRRGGDRHRGYLGEKSGRRHRPDRQAGLFLWHRRPWRPETIKLASRAAKAHLQWASELRREERPLKDLWVSTKCGESDTTSGIGSNPCVGNAFDQLYPHGVTLVFGETTELTGGEHLVAARCRNDQVRKKFQAVFDRYQK